MEHRRRSISSYLNVPDNTLDDLCSRFLLNIPATEKHDMIRLCFQIELAHWFYLDFYRQEQPSLPDCKVREFAKLVFEKYPFLLKPSTANVDDVIEKWRDYKKSVPTYGAVILDKKMDHVLLVQGFLVRSSWGFPKGKVNKDETPMDCAAREVLEETGFDIKPYIKPTEFIELRIMEQLTRLYYVVGVPSLTVFVPKTRGEIKSVEWFNLDDLPCHKRDQTPKKNLSLGPNSFFMVIPFVKSIRKWISDRKNKFQVTTRQPKGAHLNKSKAPDKSLEGAIKTPDTPVGCGTNKGIVQMSKEEELRQRQSFARANNKELQKILNLKSGQDRLPKESASQNSYHYYDSSSPANHSYSASRGRGRLLYEPLSEHWKNYKIDRAALENMIDQFFPS